MVKKLNKRFLAGGMIAALVVTTFTGPETIKRTEQKSNMATGKIVQEVAISAEAVTTGTAAGVAEQAIASYSFDSTDEVKNMNPSHTKSEIKEVSGCGSVLVMGERLRNKTYGVEITNPYAGKSAIYAETLAEALENTGITYNGTIDDEITMNDSAGEPFQALDTTLMPMDGRTYPYPTYKKGITLSAWVRVPEHTTENATLLMFKRRVNGLGIGGLSIRMDGSIMFWQGDQTTEVCQNCYYFHHNMEGTDPLSKAGQWVFITVAVQNDLVRVYFDGKEAVGEADSQYVNGATRRKYFNRGFGYRDPEFKLENPSEYYKNYRDLLSKFTEEERATGDFSDYSKYYFLNSSGETILDVLTHEDAQFYVGGDNGGAFWGWGEYTDYAVGLMVDDLSFFGSVLNDEEVAGLYQESVMKMNHPAVEEPESSVQPSKIPEVSESVIISEEPEMSEKPVMSNTPVTSDIPETSKIPLVSEIPDASAKPGIPEITGKPTVSEAPETSQPVIVTPGDVDFNGRIELADAQMALKAALKIIILPEGQLEAADVDGNGIIELEDARTILKAALKIESIVLK